MSIEETIIDRDRRGVSSLRPHLPDDYCDRAARLMLEHPGRAIIATGFYILAAGAAETDGPPGAVAIGRALEAIGYEVVYVTDRYCAEVLTALAGPEATVVDFPIEGHDASRRHADELLARVDPTVLVSIERCGLNRQGLYLNMHGRDISAYTAKLDHLFTGHPASVGIGDGGNEIGMGNLAAVIPTVPSLVETPCVTTTTELVISSVSNWGGYGLVAALSRRVGRDLLPSVEAEQSLVTRAAELGTVDSVSLKAEPRVDGFDLEENSRTVRALHDLLSAEGVDD